MTPFEVAMTKARSQMIMAHPFFGAIAVRMKVIEITPEVEEKFGCLCDTAATDGKNLYMAPKFIKTLTAAEIVGVIAHEVMHVAMLHILRKGSREHGLWNAAGDYAINGILEKSGFKLPKDRLQDSAYDGMGAEEIYTLLNQENDDGGSAPNWGIFIEPTDKDGKPLSNADKDLMEQEIKSAIIQATIAAKAQGKMPGYLEELINSILQPRIPWRQVLQRFLLDRIQGDSNWRKPNRKFVHQGIYLPSNETLNISSLVFCIDTSASVTKEEITEFLAEVNEAHAQMKPEKTYLLAVDAKVSGVQEFGPYDTITFNAVGRGGTDFNPPFDWLEERNITPRALIYLTDGYGTFPELPVSFPTLWVINNTKITPPWGEHIVISVD